MHLSSFLLATLVLLAGLALGERLPDVEQHTSLLVHRSILTHELLLPMSLFWFAVGTKANSVRMFAMGSCLEVGVHLSYDLFPKAWVGFALIQVPVIGWTYPAVSWLWIASSIIGSLYLAMRLVKRRVQGVALVLGGAACSSMLALMRSECGVLQCR